MDNPTIPKKRFNRFINNRETNQWEFDAIEEFDYDFKVENDKETKYVLIEDNYLEDLKSDNALIKPAIQIQNNTNAKPLWKSILEVIAWIAGIAGTIYLFVH